MPLKCKKPKLEKVVKAVCRKCSDLRNRRVLRFQYGLRVIVGLKQGDCSSLLYGLRVIFGLKQGDCSSLLLDLEGRLI